MPTSDKIMGQSSSPSTQPCGSRRGIFILLRTPREADTPTARWSGQSRKVLGSCGGGCGGCLDELLHWQMRQPKLT